MAARLELVVVVSNERGRYAEVFDFEAPLYRAAVAQGYAHACDYQFLPHYQLHVLVRPGSTLGASLSCDRGLRGLPHGR